jgi:hypothetical protein
VAEKEVGYVLESSPTGEAQTIPGFPGIWEQGVPKSVSELGMSATEARRWIKERGITSLKEVKVAAPKAGAFDRTAGMVSGATLSSSTDEVLPREPNSVPGLSDEELAERDRFDAEYRSRPNAVGALSILPDDRPTAPIEGGPLVSPEEAEPTVKE